MQAANGELATEAAEAIDAYHAATDRLAEALAADDAAEKALDRRYSPWKGRGADALEAHQRVINVAHTVRDAATERLIRAILALDPTVKPYELFGAARKHWKPRGIVSAGTVYLLAPVDGLEDPSEHKDGQEHEKGWGTTILAVPLSSIVELNDVAEDRDEEADEEDYPADDNDDPQATLAQATLRRLAADHVDALAEREPGEGSIDTECALVRAILEHSGQSLTFDPVETLKAEGARPAAVTINGRLFVVGVDCDGNLALEVVEPDDADDLDAETE
jgi:hypothetical protein